MKDDQRSVAKRDVLAGAVAGVAGGLAASFVMEAFQQMISELSRKKGDDKKEEHGDIPANEKAAVAISETVFGHKLTQSGRKEAGEAVHYAMGGVSGLIYGVASEFSPVPSTAAGLPFGTAVWAIADDVAVPALGLSKPPAEFPVSTHLYALSSHLVYGVTTDIVRRGVRKLLAE
jgi:uncharacterized membrane protein YagU involved in acid resistance